MIDFSRNPKAEKKTATTAPRKPDAPECRSSHAIELEAKFIPINHTLILLTFQNKQDISNIDLTFHGPPGASHTLWLILEFRLRCKGCKALRGFRITIFDNPTRGDNSKPRLECMVVAGE